MESAGEFDGVFFDSPGVAKVKWDPTTQAVTTEWQGWADQADFIAVLEAGLRAIKKHRSSRGLVDSRRQRALPQAEQDWVNTHWFPQALRAGLSRLALVIPESGLAMMNIEDVVSRVRGTNLDVAYFATVAEAKEWLTEEPTSAPIASASLPVS